MFHRVTSLNDVGWLHALHGRVEQRRYANFRDRAGAGAVDGERHLRRTDLRTVYIGSLKGHRIPSFRSPVAGLPVVHWNERHSVDRVGQSFLDCDHKNRLSIN